MTITFQPAERKDVKALILLAGTSGSGKTYSAILMARGLVGPEGRIGFIDTESGRGSHYSNLAGGYAIAELHPPFTPHRYIEAVDAAEAAGYDALIIDSISHEWEGEGGCVELAEQIELATKRPGLHCWAKPKSQHKKLINRLLRTRMHVIFCARAREKSVQVRNGGKTEIVSAGIQPIVEKNFPFEMLLSATMDEASKVPLLTKCPEELLQAFPADARISIETGRKIAEWLSGGVAVDPEHQEVASAGREAARAGMIPLQDWWKTLSTDQQRACEGLLRGELKSIAAAVDEMATDTRAMSTAGGTPAPAPGPKAVEKDPLFDEPVNAETLLDDFKKKVASMEDITELALHMSEFEKSESWAALAEAEQAQFREVMQARVTELAKGSGEDAPSADPEIPFDEKKGKAA